jgi:hypothetical protein
VLQKKKKKKKKKKKNSLLSAQLTCVRNVPGLNIVDTLPFWQVYVVFFSLRLKCRSGSTLFTIASVHIPSSSSYSAVFPKGSANSSLGIRGKISVTATLKFTFLN